MVSAIAPDDAGHRAAQGEQDVNVDDAPALEEKQRGERSNDEKQVGQRLRQGAELAQLDVELALRKYKKQKMKEKPQLAAIA